jgi:hypothetical protein
MIIHQEKSLLKYAIVHVKLLQGNCGEEGVREQERKEERVRDSVL